MKQIYSTFQLGDMCAVYLLDTDSQICGLTLVPAGYENQLDLEGWWNVEPTVQIKLVGEPYPDGFIHGHSMKNSLMLGEIKFKEQKTEGKNPLRIITISEGNGIETRHILEYVPGSLYMTMYSQVISHREEVAALELFTSYNLCAFSSLGGDLRMEDYVLHRMQSKWSMEGKLESNEFLDLHMEPAWLRIGANSVRFGQVGSMPVRRYFPWMVAEDKKFGYGIGAQLAHPASWQMEVYNKDERVALSGGLADREFGHWTKNLQKDKLFESPKAYLTVAKEDVEGISYRLTSAQWGNLEKVPEVEKSLPIIFNEYCTTWGNPSEENMLKIVDAIKGKGIQYCVIDAGWHVKDGNDWSDIGDWITNEKLFPKGLKYVADKIREAGMLPGIWYEMEVVGKDSDVFKKPEYLLKRDGYPLQTCFRRFLDMREEVVQEYLEERVINQLEEWGFDYLKVDYNDNIGIGCDGAESLGEGLRQNMMASQDFWRKLGERLPNLVIENCSSGGHRLEPSMQALASMASFSDAHEWKAIPVIAANVTRAILPAQSQIWAVLRKDDDEKRLYYSLACTFLGRMCLSGDIYDIKDWQWEIVQKAIDFYKVCAPVIKQGRNFRVGSHVKSYNHLKGWQAVCRRSADEQELLVVLHTFEECENSQSIALAEFAGGEWQIADVLAREDVQASLGAEGLTVTGLQEYDSFVCLLKRKV